MPATEYLVDCCRQPARQNAGSERKDSKRENRETSHASQLTFDWDRSVNATGGKTGRHAGEESDESVVPTNLMNNAATEAAAESGEERDSAERNAKQTDTSRTPSRKKPVSLGLLGVREAARKDRTLKFVNLLHHVSVECLRDAFFNLKKLAAVGVDEVTWHE